MNIKSITALTAVCAVAAGGTGAAVAASDSGTSGAGSGKSRSAHCGKPGDRRGGPGDAIAKALGITPTQLRDQLRSGKKLSEIATSKGKTLDEIKAAVKATLKTRLDKAVAAGEITQAQADERLSHVDEMIDDIEAGKKPAGPPPGGGGPGQGAGFGGPPAA